MHPLDLVKLTQLMELTSGRPEVRIGLIDGPVAIDHPDLASENIRELPSKVSGSCTTANSIACVHGTFVAGILFGKRNFLSPAICPDVTKLVRPIFLESAPLGQIPSASPEELAEAIIETVNAGARVINLSAAMVSSSAKGERELQEALDYAMKRSVIIVAAAGNQGTVGSTCITRHPWVISVAACDLQGRPLNYSNLGNSIGRHGLSAPGENITSLGSDGRPLTFSGTSAAAPFVTGVLALLYSLFPESTATEIKLSVLQLKTKRRTSVVPPVLHAGTAYQDLARIYLPQIPYAAVSA
jgi:subtilisin family serine protease